MFAAFLGERRLSGNSIRTYCGCLKTLHSSLGLPFSRPDILSKVIKGLEHMNGTPGATPRRAHVTPQQLAFLQTKVEAAPLPRRTRDLVWMCFSWQWHGCLRVSEVAAATASSFLDSTLKGKDVSIQALEGHPGRNYILLTLRDFKHSKKPALVELLPTGRPTCPVKAYQEVFREGPPDPDSPLVTISPGLFVGPRLLNQVLSEAFKGTLPPGTTISTHSLRMGLPTLMGARGYSESEIQLQGRWNSNSYLSYCREGRGLRLKDQLDLFNALF